MPEFDEILKNASFWAIHWLQNGYRDENRRQKSPNNPHAFLCDQDENEYCLQMYSIVGLQWSTYKNNKRAHIVQMAIIV